MMDLECVRGALRSTGIERGGALSEMPPVQEPADAARALRYIASPL
jgi:hypothetical protein